jgi:outer membrane protein OmpA-like peptidoglycan-associated protein
MIDWADRRMRLASILGASVLLLSAAPAAAQVYPGEEVTVNPGAIGNGYLLYPGGKYGRHVGTLLMPGDRRGGVIHLHMPVKHRHVAKRPTPPAAVATADAAPETTMSVTSPTPAPAPAHPAKRTAAATPPPAAAAPTADLNSLPEDSAARLVGEGGAPAKPAKPVKAAKPAPTAAPPPAPADTGAPPLPFSFGGPRSLATAAPPPKRVASANPPPAASTPPATATGLKRQSVIPFPAGQSSPAATDVYAIHALANSLNAALNAGAQRVQLEAYGGPRGDKSSDSRRLSLKRALVIRELLIEDGVPSEKIDVRAMGGVEDSGATDRVDVFVRA